MFGPTGVSKEHQGKGIGRALLLHCLEGMMHDGYAYGIIGAVSEQVQPFYQKSCGSIPIQNSKKIYNRLTRY
jgi:ribosomal protein S18 acetylase RimI-like enzyme